MESQSSEHCTVGFHIRIPFRVNMPGTYTFRQHADYGTGAFVGVDGATVQAATWGHLNLDPQSLAAGERPPACRPGDCML